MTLRADSPVVRSSRHSGLALRIGAVVALAAFWQLVTVVVADPIFWPQLTDIAGRLWSEWLASPAAWVTSIAPSVGRLLAGWLVAVVAGIGLGVLIGSSKLVRDLSGPLIGFLRSIPPPALLPLFIVLLGIDDSMKVASIAFGAVWPILLNTADGVASVDPLVRDVGRALRLSPRDRLTGIVLPAAAPRIFAGLRISLSIAVILMVISELVATVDGIGFELVQAQRAFRTVDVWAITLLLGLLGFVLNALLLAVEHRMLAWQRGATGAIE